MTQPIDIDDDWDDDGFEDDEQTYPPLADFVSPWFAEEASRRTGLRRARIVRTAERFYDCLEAEAERFATDGERAMLALERQFSPTGAAARVMPMDALPDALRAFLSPAWLPADPQDRRVQVQMVGALCARLLRVRPGEEQWSTCALLDLQCEVDRLRQSDEPSARGNA
jgi:hypothetical protein